MSEHEQPIQQDFMLLSLGDNGGEKIFKSKTDLEDWIRSQLQFWEDLVNSPRGIKTRPFQSHLIRKLRDPLKRLLSSISKFSEAEPSEPRAQLRKEIETVFQSNGVICSASTLGQHFSLLRDKYGIDAAQGAMCLYWNVTLVDEDFSQLSPSFFRGMYAQAIHESANDPVPVDYSHISEELARHRTFLQEIYTLKQEVITAKLLAVNDMDDKIRGVDKEFSEKCSDFEKQMNRIREEYNDKIPTESAVRYWSQRKYGYACWSWIWGAVAVGLFLAVGWSVIHILNDHESDFARFASIMRELDPSLDVSSLTTTYTIQRFPKYIALFLLGAWVLRIVVRNYLAAMHLSLDASERAVLVQTYLGLLRYPAIRESKELKEQIMPRLLESIFRHSQDGIIKDDAFVGTVVDGLFKPGGK